MIVSPTMVTAAERMLRRPVDPEWLGQALEIHRDDPTRSLVTLVNMELGEYERGGETDRELADRIDRLLAVIGVRWLREGPGEGDPRWWVPRTAP